MHIHTSHHVARTDACQGPCHGEGEVMVPADRDAFAARFDGQPLDVVTRLRAGWAEEACLEDDLDSDRRVVCPVCQGSGGPPSTY